ncbi:acyl-CoA oxidase [Martiniozyma asiatica (nom. inval.)]|nr:acyl-CoA oxidase [Martiniozyma asiatica]
METLLPDTTEPDPQQLIWKERLATKFSLNEMHEFLEGSKEAALETLTLEQQIERDAIFKMTPEYYEMSKNDHRLETAKKIARLAQYMEQDAPNFDKFQNRLNLIAMVDPQLGTRVGVHLGLFLGAIRGNGTSDQFNYWAFERGAIYMKDIYGCFSMTEIGHGSNVAALQTTATFNIEKDVFTINTPHVGATKWWIGGAAHSATHTVVFARLIVNNKDHGVKTFVVPLRDCNHDLWPGITIGDIGAKMGRDGIDNGWIQFSNVEIPREYMLSKFTKIDKEGNVEEPPLAQLAYGALLGGRVTMVTDSFRTGERFITIALRYAVGRRQFTIKGENIENQLINYPLHQKRLLPYLSWVYGMSIASNQIQKDYKETLINLDEGVKSGDFNQLKIAIDSLKGIFADSASLKSTCTWITASLIDESRQSCGGHGYSSYAGFSKGYADHVVQCTWEGDNNILAQNSGRITIQKAMNLNKCNGNYQFLKESSKSGHVLNNLTSINEMLMGIDAVILRISLKCIDHINKTKDWDSIGAEKLSLSKLYAARYILSKWIDRLDNYSDNVKDSLLNLAKLFALSNIESFGVYFLQHDVIAREVMDKMSNAMTKLLALVRQDTIGLTDSFKLSDYFLNSVLGKYNGDIYHNYLNTVKELNDPSVTHAPYANDFLKMLNRADVPTREKGQKSASVLSKLNSDEE